MPALAHDLATDSDPARQTGRAMLCNLLTVWSSVGVRLGKHENHSQARAATGAAAGKNGRSVKWRIAYFALILSPGVIIGLGGLRWLFGLRGCLRASTDKYRRSLDRRDQYSCQHALLSGFVGRGDEAGKLKGDLGYHG